MFSARLVVVSFLVAAVVAQDEKAKQSLPMGPPLGYSPDIYNQFGLQYPALGGQYFPGPQPPIVYYGGGAIPGQQFLYRPGSPPPGNFLIPQPSPGVGYPQTPVFQAGYPKPAHIPPIEKDAEEVPDLAGNHPPTRTGRPFYQSGDPERIETFDEPIAAGEQDDLAEVDKVPNFYPKKAFPARPVLRPGQQFFILNGNTLFSNIPTGEQPQIPRQIHPLQQQPIYHEPQPIEKQGANYISLNNLADFNQPQAVPIPIYRSQAQVPVAALVIPVGPKPSRIGKNIPVAPPVSGYFSGVHYPFIIALDNSQREDDDTVTIEAKPAEEVRKVAEKPIVKDEEEEASLSQSKPSAVALSGKGGVASAGPRGTALVGNRGVAVASPEATAVAGPANDETEQPDRKMRPKKER